MVPVMYNKDATFHAPSPYTYAQYFNQVKNLLWAKRLGIEWNKDEMVPAQMESTWLRSKGVWQNIENDDESVVCARGRVPYSGFRVWGIVSTRS